MSSMFQFLDEIDNSQMLKPLTRSRTYHEIKPNVVKNIGGLKPKGLSVRSISEMNVSHNTHLNIITKNEHSKQKQDFLKLKVTQVDSNGALISPGKKVPGKKLIVQSNKYKELALKEETMIDKSIKTPVLMNNEVFKKPLPYKRYIKTLPEPQKMAHYYEFEHEFNYEHIKAIEKDFRDMCFKDKENIALCVEEKFLSDSKTLISVDVPKLILSGSFEEECKEFSNLELPEISDNED